MKCKIIQQKDFELIEFDVMKAIRKCVTVVHALVDKIMKLLISSK